MKLIGFAFALLIAATPAFGHCDWIRGPVVLDAKAALAKGNLGPVLKWIPAASEREVRDAFARATTVRAQTPEARELADHWFFDASDSAGAGREYVHAYAKFVHYVLGIRQRAAGAAHVHE